MPLSRIFTLLSQNRKRKLSSAIVGRIDQLHGLAQRVWQMRRPEDARGTIERIVRLWHKAAPTTTLDQEDSNLRHWTAYCADMDGGRWIRPSLDDLARRGQEYVLLEQVFWANALPYIMQRQRDAWEANSRERALPPRPASALQMLRGVRRVHIKRMGIAPVSLTSAVQVCEGLMREYVETHGPEALLPERKEPLTRQLIIQLLTLAAGTKFPGAPPVDYSEHPWVAIRAMMATLAQCGFRKAEVAVKSAAHASDAHLTFASVSWRIAAVHPTELIIDPTPEQLALLAPGDYALLRPPPSKADQFGIIWGTDPIYLPFEPVEVICAARYLAELEIVRRVRGGARGATPLFADSNGKPFTHSFLDKLLHAMLRSLGLTETEARRYSWHSFRVFLACALLAQGCDGPTIQCMLRWRTPEALRLYARLNAEAYSQRLQSAIRADISSVRTTMWRLPTVDAHDQVAALRDGLARMYVVADRGDQGLDEEGEQTVDPAGAAE